MQQKVYNQSYLLHSDGHEKNKHYKTLIIILYQNSQIPKTFSGTVERYERLIDNSSRQASKMPY